ncbi:MAG: transporter substrate-binding domain-containing protein [Cyanobacteria bacterium J06621_12]
MFFTKKLKSIFLFISVMCFILLIGNNSLLKAQTYEIPNSEFPSKILIGIRTSAKSIGYQRESGTWGGFCYFFGRELENEFKRDGINADVDFYSKPIANSYLGKKAPRYDGLKQGKIHIECGSNTILDREYLVNKKWNHVRFSESFHSTGIKLLIKQDSFKLINSLSFEESLRNLKDKKIGVVRQTTTYDALKHAGYRPISSETRVESLQDLENGHIDAFASDALILKTLLKKDYQSIDSPEKYTLYPKEPNEYLPNTEVERYGLAILRDTDYEDILIKKINDTIESGNLAKYRSILSESESATSKDVVISQYKNALEETERENFDLKDKLNSSFPKWSLSLAVISAVVIIFLASKFFNYVN